MRIDPGLFLEALGTKLVGDPAETGRRTPLSCRCPLHASEGRMVVVQLSSGNLLCRCTDPACRFNGDAVALVMAKYGVSLQAAVSMLRCGGVLSGCLREPLLAAEADALAEKAASQARVRAYLAKCVEQLARNPARSRLRAGLDVSTYNLLPPEIGLLVASDDMPDAFGEYRKPKYRKSTLLTFPYTFDGDVMHVGIVDAATKSLVDDVSIVRPDLGVFGEESLMDGTAGSVQIVTDPVALSIFYGTLRKSMLERPRLVAVSGFPLPYSCAGASRLNVIEFADSKVSLDFLLEPLGSSDVIEGASEPPNIRFYRRAGQSLDARPEAYAAASDISRHSAEDGMPALEVLAGRISDMLDMGKTAQVEEALRRHPLSEENRTHLLEFARQNNLNEAFRRLLCDEAFSGSRRLVLGNRRTLVNEATAIYAERPDLRLDPLTNFGIRVLNRTRGFDGTDSLSCTITPEDKSVQPVDVSIPEDAWSSASRMRRLVSRAFSTRGASPYIAMYTPSGVDWYDVMLKLAEGCRIQREIVKLGVDEAHDIQFPAVTVDRRARTVEAQQGVVNIPAEVADRYSGLACCTDRDWPGALRLLLEHGDSVEAAAILAGLGYMSYRTACIAKRGKVPSHGGRHLFFVETEENCFEGAISALNSILTDEPVAEVSPGAPVKSLQRYRQLGTLPLVCRIPRVENIQRLLGALDESEFPVIASVDSYTASLINGRIRSEFVTPSNERPGRYDASKALLSRLRAGLPDLLLRVSSGEVPDDAEARAPSSVLGHRLLCAQTGCADTNCVKEVVSLVFAGAGMSGVDSFFERLHRGVVGVGSKFNLCVVYGAPQPGYSFTRRGQHVFVLEDRVLLCKYTVDLVNKFSHNVFSIPQLDAELSERELLVAPPEGLDIDAERCWCIPREVYEDRIVGKPLVIGPIHNDTKPCNP